MRILRRAVLLVFTLLLVCVLAILFVPERWVADRIESAASTFLDAELRIGSLDLNRLSLTPSAQLSDVDLTGPEDNEILDVGNFLVSLDFLQLFKGNVVFEQIELTDSLVDLSIDDTGQGNWQFLLDATAGEDAPEDTQADQTEPEAGQESQAIAIPLINELSVESLNVKFDDQSTSRTADLTIAASGSTVSTEQPGKLDVSGDVNGESVSLETVLTPSAPITIPPENLELDVKAALGGSTITAAGSLEDVTTLGDIDLDFSVKANGLQELENVVGLGLPELPPFSLAGSVDREDSFIVLRRFDGNLGNTTLEGDVRLDYTTTPITVYANVISSLVDLDDLAGLVGATPDTATADDTQSNSEQNEPEDGRLLPNGPIDLLPLTRLFNGTIDYRAESVKSEQLPISRLNLKAEIDGLKLAIAPASIDIADGNINGSINFDVAPDSPEGVLELEVNRLSLRDLLESTGIDDDSLGVIGGRVKFWMNGKTVSEMAANLDGGVFLLMTEGKLDSLLSEVAGLDVFESISVLIDPDQPLTEIRCAYVDMHSKSGLMNIANLVIDTEDTVFLAEGSVDLNDESLDVTIEPHPKDLSVLAARTAVELSGTFGEPAVVPGRSLPMRAAAAAALGVLATPILAIVPFIEAGTGEDSNYCSGLIDSLGEAEAETE